MHAPKSALRKHWERIVILILLTGLTAALSGGMLMRENGKTQLARTRQALAARLMPGIQDCARIGRRMGYAGADIRGQLIPELKILLPAITQLNLVTGEICGREYMPVDEGLLRRIDDTVSMLEAGYRKNDSTRQLEETLRQKLLVFEDILISRFTADGDIVRLGD